MAEETKDTTVDNAVDYKALYEQTKAERDRFKASNDKLCTENAEHKRKAREREAREEAERTANLTAEQRLQEAEERATAREKAAQKRENVVSAREAFAKAEIGEESYNAFLDVLVNDDPEESANRVASWIESYTKSVHAGVEKQAQLYKSAERTPRGTETMVKSFKDMTVDERTALKRSDPAEYERRKNIKN
jgi:predicted nucleotide-binding protein